MIEKVISGGQCGADYAALVAAEEAGIPTGGWMPNGFRTKYGPRPEYRDRFGLVCTEADSYPPRTRLNVRDSDATVRLAIDFASRGEQLTKKLCIQMGKPMFDVNLKGNDYPKTVPQLVDWLAENEVKVLNVAGNAMLHIEPFVVKYLGEVFARTQR